MLREVTDFFDDKYYLCRPKNKYYTGLTKKIICIIVRSTHYILIQFIVDYLN
jgi:hypothetical protein